VEAVIQMLPSGLILIVTFALVAWTSGALFYDVGRASRCAWILVLLWIAAVVATYVIWLPWWQPFLLLLTLFLLFLSWWLLQKPSNDRHWEPTAAVLPRVDIRDDIVSIDNVRNADYHASGDSTPPYDRRIFHLSRLRGVDAFVCFWGSPWMSHPIFVFDFGSDGRVCFSIEVRYRLGQKYNLLRSLYRQQELIYHVCDERDVLLRRTKSSPEQDVYLYRINATESEMHRFFMEYVEQVNILTEHPRWYNGLTTNCTTSIYAQREDQMAWDWRVLLNGTLDQLLYDRKRLDQSMPFETLKRQSRVTEIANRAPLESFGDFIRSELPAYQPQPIVDE
jgi:hypothetical protein